MVARFRNGLPFRLELAPLTRPAPAQPPKGTRLVRIGDQEFDRGFVVQANDPEMAVEFLSAAVRWSIGNLQRIAPPGGMLISINPERLLLQIDRNLGLQTESLTYAVQQTLLIHDGLQAGSPRGCPRGFDCRGRPHSERRGGPHLQSLWRTD